MKIKSLLFTVVLATAVFGFTGLVNAQSLTVNQILAQIASLTAQLKALQNQGATPASWCYTFNTDFGIGATTPRGTSFSGDLSALQTALTKEGINTAEGQYTTFNEDVAAAVVQYQQKYGIRASGWVGPKTRKKLNSLYGCGITSPNQPTCSNLYWFDNTSSNNCQTTKQFCGAYMYYGLQTFNTQQDCLNGLNISSTTVVNGVCGSVNGITTSTSPTANLCSLGTASTVSNNSGLGYWQWQCAGGRGGLSANCSAPVFNTNQPIITPANQTVASNQNITFNFSYPANTTTAVINSNCPTGVIGGTCGGDHSVLNNNNYVAVFNNSTSQNQTVTVTYSTISSGVGYNATASVIVLPLSSQPVISYLSPTSASPGTSVTIYGTNLLNANTITLYPNDNHNNGTNINASAADNNGTNEVFVIPQSLASGNYSLAVWAQGSQVSSNEVSLTVTSSGVGYNASQDSLASISNAIANIMQQIKTLSGK